MDDLRFQVPLVRNLGRYDSSLESGAKVTPPFFHHSYGNSWKLKVSHGTSQSVGLSHRFVFNYVLPRFCAESQKHDNNSENPRVAGSIPPLGSFLSSVCRNWRIGLNVYARSRRRNLRAPTMCHHQIKRLYVDVMI